MDLPQLAFTKFKLDNGLTLIVHEDHKAPVVAVSIWYHVGSADEPVGKTGFAHLFEHLMFSGSEHHRDLFMKPFEAVGATDQNGTTWFDRTNYFQTVPTTALDLALWMESDRMGHLLGAIGQHELDTQRGVVKNEKRQNENQPYGRAMEQLLRNAYPANHPYRHETIGSMADLDAASLEDVGNWFNAFYGAANTVLVLAGDITPAEAREKVARHFGHIPAGPPVERQQSWIAPRHESRRGTQRDKVAQARLIREWNVPGLGHRDTPILQMAAWILGGAPSSRLQQRLVYRDRLADHVSVGLQAFALAGMFSVQVDIGRDVDPGRVEAAITDEWAAFLRDGPTDDEVVRARGELVADFVQQFEKVGGFAGKATILAEGELYRGDPVASRDDMRCIKAATPEIVVAAAKHWLAKGDYTLMVVPTDDVADTLAEKDEGLPASPDRPEPLRSPPPAKPYLAAPGAIDRSRGYPAVDHFPDVAFPDVERARLDNGIEVIVAPRDTIPVTRVRLQFDAGLAAEEGANSGVANMAMAVLNDGTEALDRAELARHQQRLGAKIFASSSPDTSVVDVRALNSGLVDALALASDLLANPAWRPGDVERAGARQAAGIRQQLSSPEGLGGRLLPRLLFGAGHPYGVPLSGTGSLAAVQGLTPADLSAYHRDWLHPESATIFVTGDTTLDRILPLLERNFGQWAPSTARKQKRTILAETPASRRIVLIDRPGVQSQIMAGRRVSPSHFPNSLPLDLANAAFGGIFTSRLNLNLREDKRWTYGARSALVDLAGERPLMINAAVQAERTADAIAEIVKEMESFAGSHPPDADEIAKVKAQRVRALPGSFETSLSILNTLTANQLLDRPDDYVPRLRNAIEVVEAGEIASAAGLFAPEMFDWIVIGDLARIETEIRALHIGEVVIFDANDIG